MVLVQHALRIVAGGFSPFLFPDEQSASITSDLKQNKTKKTHRSSRSFPNFVSRFSLDNVRSRAAGRCSCHFPPSCFTAAELHVKPLHGDCLVDAKAAVLVSGFIISGQFLSRCSNSQIYVKVKVNRGCPRQLSLLSLSFPALKAKNKSVLLRLR